MCKVTDIKLYSLVQFKVYTDVYLLLRLNVLQSILHLQYRILSVLNSLS